jgi:hypothetical protein
LQIKTPPLTSLECAEFTEPANFHDIVQAVLPLGCETQMDLIAKAVTLKSIKLHDSTAKELIFSAKHAVLYTFNTGKGSWVPRQHINRSFFDSL